MNLIEIILIIATLLILFMIAYWDYKSLNKVPNMENPLSNKSPEEYLMGIRNNPLEQIPKQIKEINQTLKTYYPYLRITINQLEDISKIIWVINENCKDQPNRIEIRELEENLYNEIKPKGIENPIQELNKYKRI